MVGTRGELSSLLPAYLPLQLASLSRAEGLRANHSPKYDE